MKCNARLGYSQPMTIRSGLAAIMLLAALGTVAGCERPPSGPLSVSAIGEPPRSGNPNLIRLANASAILLQASAQGLVRFDAAGQIEPALAQSWIVSDDGLRYTFRLARITWTDGSPIEAAQVAARLRAASSRASRNPMKPLLGAIDEIEAMTETVIEIRLLSPRPNFLQLLAQPEMAVLRNGRGSGPYEAVLRADNALLLRQPKMLEAEEEDETGPQLPEILLRGERVSLAVARFDAGAADLVTGGTLGDLAVARVAEPGRGTLRFDPVAGNFGLLVRRGTGALADAAVRNALSMTIDRAGLVEALAVSGLQTQDGIVPSGINELPDPARPAWTNLDLPSRRGEASRLLASVGRPVTVRVAMPDSPGYRLVFAHLKRDWQQIGVNAQRVGARDDADLQLVDEVAPIMLATWYLRRYVCGASAICSPEADRALAAARIAPTAEERRTLLQEADAAISATVPFIPIAAPVRWSLVGTRATGFQPNPFSRRFPGSLVAVR